MKYTTNYYEQIEKLKNAINSSSCIIVGAGAGLSTSAGLTYSGERFIKYFQDFHEKYHINDMYSGGFYPYQTLEEYWAWWSRHIYYNRYDIIPGKPYYDLLKILKDKEYFILTTNVDHQFQLAGFEKEKLFYTQGDYGLFQCSKPCHRKTYDNEEQIREMVKLQKDMKIPTNLITYCPKCGGPMTVNLRVDNTFVQDKGWYNAKNRYDSFINEHKNEEILFLELGVGNNTPGIIKYPFWKATYDNKKATYACINLGESFCPKEIYLQSICINNDIGDTLEDLLENHISN